MNNPNDTEETNDRDFSDTIAQKQRRKLKARREGEVSAWFGLGMFGLVGWAVAIPTLVGIGLGWWIDRTWQTRYSWTLMLLVGGIFLGMFNAWQWISREREAIHHSDSEETEEHD